MNKKWIAAFTTSIIFTLLFCFSVNYFADPVGVFNQGGFCYDFLDNIRHNKIKYLDKNHEFYDSYIIGGSKAGTLQPNTLNQYIEGASFYNNWVIMGGFYDYEKTIKYMIDHYNVRNILLQISIYEYETYGPREIISQRLHPNVSKESKFKFYSEYLFLNLSQSITKLEKRLKRSLGREISLYNVEDGTMIYSQPNQNVSIEEYLEQNPGFKVVENRAGYNKDIIDQNIASLKEIKSYCDANDVNLIVVTAPTYTADMDSFDIEGLRYFWESIVEVVEFWDFTGYNSINQDPRNFYDRDHYNKEIADLMLARIFNNEDIDIPDDFGVYRTKENIKTPMFEK